MAGSDRPDVTVVDPNLISTDDDTETFVGWSPEIPGEDEDEDEDADKAGDADGGDDKSGDSEPADGDGGEPADGGGDGGDKGSGADDETTRYAEFGRAWEENMERDPVGTGLRVIQALASTTPDFAAQVIKALGGSTAEPTQDQGKAEPDPFQDYEPASDLEAELVKHVKNIRALPQLEESVEQALGETQAKADAVKNDVHGLSFMLRTTSMLLSRVLTAQGVSVPEVDVRAVSAAVRAGKSIDEALEEHYGKAVDKALATLKQKSAPRPDTPRASTASAPSRKRHTTMLGYWKDIVAEQDAAAGMR